MPISVREGMVVPSGQRFVPDDLSLVRSFLRRKIANLPLLPRDFIFEFDVYGTEPWNVPDVYGPGDESDEEAPWLAKPKKIVKEGYKGYYFVRSSAKRERTIIKSGDGGYWKKVNHGHRDVRDKKNKLVGLKRTFVFHRYTDEKKDHAEKTDWILNEYSLNSKKFQPWVLCSVRNKLEYSKAYLSDDEDEEFLQQDEQVTKLIDGVEEIDIQNASIKQIDRVEEIDIQNAGSGDLMEEEDN